MPHRVIGAIAPREKLGQVKMALCKVVCHTDQNETVNKKRDKYTSTIWVLLSSMKLRINLGPNLRFACRGLRATMVIEKVMRPTVHNAATILSVNYE